MKLTELAIDGYGNFRNLHLGRFTDGLNFIYGENQSGKSSLRKFIRESLFGAEAADYSALQNVDQSGGYLNVRCGSEEFRINRDSQLNGKHQVYPLSVSSRVTSVNQLTGDLTPSIYDTVYSFSFRETRQNAQRLSTVLNTMLGVPRGPAAAGDDGAYQNWRREADSRGAKLNAVQQRIEELNRQKNGCLSEIENAETSQRTRLADTDRQIQSVSAQINGFDLQQKQQHLVAIDREIAELRALIEQSIKHVSYIPTVQSSDPFATLYQRLDEIDNQIRRWRRVQSDIQTQRVRLKDEMVVWSELTLESSEHPYHNAREILVALENKVDQAERHSGQWNQNQGQRTNPGQLAIAIQDLCKQMRDDLYGLCQELGQQYKHIRHKAAAAELKQLRRCYNEMGENTQRLVRRRDAVINEIRHIDPAGADAIIRSETGFCQCAMHEGYLEARKKFVSNVPSHSSTHVSHQIVQPDLSEERRRLETLDLKRRGIVSWLTNAESELATLKLRHADLVRQRESLRADLDSHFVLEKIQRIEADVRALNDEYRVLLRLVEEDRRYVQPSPNSLLVRTASLLNHLTNGELTQVYLGDVRDVAEFQVRDRIGKVRNFSALDTAQQDQVYLCLCIAAKEAFEFNSVGVPLVIDDPFANISSDRVGSTLDMLSELGRTGHQIVLLTQHRYLADRIPGTAVFELPPMTSFPQPVTQPDRASTIPPTPGRESTYYSPTYYSHVSASSSQFDDDYLPEYGLPPQIRTYPLSKYPPIEDVTEYRERTSYIVPHPVVSREEATPFAVGYDRQFSTTNHNANNVGAIPVDRVADRLGYAVAFDDHTVLDQTDLLDLNQLRCLSDARIETVGQLLELDPNELPNALRDQGISGDQVDRWQAQVWLLSNVPGLRVADARILVACGVTEPEHLATSHAQQLFERVQRFLASADGQRFGATGNQFSLDRINGWYRALDSRRSRWDRGEEFSRRSGQRYDRTPRTNAVRPEQSRFVSANQPRSVRMDSPRSENGSRSIPDRTDLPAHAFASSAGRAQRNPENERPTREPFVARPPRMRTPEIRTPETRQNALANAGSSLAPVVRQNRNFESNGSAENDSKLRFNLDLKDHVEAGPSIGPKTAERFEKIGVATVADFLKQTAESMSAKLKYKRITADVVRQWQHQARLVCRIPNLRGHDAQLLVACGFTEAEEIATMQPKQLFDIVGPFSDTKEGLKIIRSGKKPDLQEVTDWITWAANTRSLQAA